MTTERRWTSCDEAAVLRGEVEDAFGLGVGGEPVFAVDLLVVGGEGRLEVRVSGASILRDGGAVDEDDLQVLLIDPDAALEVVLVLFEDLGAGVEDVGVDVVDLLAADVGDVVVGQVGCGEDEGEAVGDLVEVGGGHGDAAVGAVVEGVLRGEDDALFAGTLLVEDDVGDLLVLADDLAGVEVEVIDFDGLAEAVGVEGVGEFGFAGAELLDDLVGGEARWWGGIELAEALLGGRGERDCEGEEESESSGGHRILGRGWAGEVTCRGTPLPYPILQSLGK